MADLKISQLSDGGAAQAADEYVVARSGANYRIDGASVAAAATSVGTLTSLTVSGDLTVDTSTLKVDSTNNRVGIGTASPSNTLDVITTTTATNSLIDTLRISAITTNTAAAGLGTGIVFSAERPSSEINLTRAAIYGVSQSADESGYLAFWTRTNTGPGDFNEKMRLDASGNLGLGVTPSAWLSAYKALQLQGGSLASSATSNVQVVMNAYLNASTQWIFTNNGYSTQYSQASGEHQWFTSTISGTAGNQITYAQRMTLDASGNLGVGATSPGARIDANVSGTPPSATSGTVARFVSAGGAGFDSQISVISGNTGGASIFFGDTDADNRGRIRYSNGDDAMLFFTAATERARITSGGNLLVGKTADDTNTPGINLLGTDSLVAVTRVSGEGLLVGRNTTDGTLVLFRQDTADEGSISISGNTVSYNAFAGSHWSQLEDGSKPEILRGTVIEAIDELCEWPGEQNERLPKCKVSDTAGSKKVYGVFMAWDNDWTETNDMYVTAVGAFVCRISADVTVQQGDLLESNGDGTARVQADDVIRSSTIGKVTSTVQTHQYEDGTYCVPVVLYCG